MFPANGVQHTVVPVLPGLQVLFNKTPVDGSLIGVVPKISEKLPFLIAIVGTE